MHDPQRYTALLNLGRYERPNPPLKVDPLRAQLPTERQMVLRTLVRAPYSNGYQIPPSLEWLGDTIRSAEEYQNREIRIRHPYCYVTVRHGEVATTGDDLWHVDGFSTKFNHLPEANYVCVVGGQPTEWLDQSFSFPDDFDPLVHNVHLFFQKRIDSSNIRQMEEGMVYFLDPYVVHRRPPNATGWRTFIRISFTPIEIGDVNNTPNPLIPTSHYTLDGVKDFRDKLLDYDNRVRLWRLRTNRCP